MRIWSLHPKYLDAKGLVALWREALLAKNVLEGRTKGYRHHPQLIRFRQSSSAVESINQYLAEVHTEALNRGYNFNGSKIDRNYSPSSIPVTIGQMEYEQNHLFNKLRNRDIDKYNLIKDIHILAPHPLFVVVEGGVEDWEII